MMRPIFLSIVLAATAAPAAAQTALQKCKAITDSLERLRCYDAIEAQPAQSPAPAAKPAAPAAAAPAAAPADDLIAKAKAAVSGELRDPGSARFDNVRVRTVAGKQAVCGFVNAKNSRGFMAGPQPFAYDGQNVYLIIYNPGPANITSLDTKSLGDAMGNRLRNHARLCR